MRWRQWTAWPVDAEIMLVKSGDHRPSKPHEIALILRVLEAMAAGLR
jgi:hypothetical protein